MELPSQSCACRLSEAKDRQCDTIRNGSSRTVKEILAAPDAHLFAVGPAKGDMITPIHTAVARKTGLINSVVIRRATLQRGNLLAPLQHVLFGSHSCPAWSSAVNRRHCRLALGISVLRDSGG
jgi:hypothetical protein